MRIELPKHNTEVTLRGNTEDPQKALLLLHGRFSSADNILGLADALPLAEDTLVCAPQAKEGQWYPQRFTVPREQNEPRLSEALAMIGELIELLEEDFKVPPEGVVQAGFSQGACLLADYAARNPRQYGGLCIFSGGLIGSVEEVKGFKGQGGLLETPVYIGCDEKDPHIPAERVVVTAEVLEDLGASVTAHLYSELGHAIHPEGLDFLKDLLSK